jgi:hypothetical protein
MELMGASIFVLLIVVSIAVSEETCGGLNQDQISFPKPKNEQTILEEEEHYIFNGDADERTFEQFLQDVSDGRKTMDPTSKGKHFTITACLDDEEDDPLEDHFSFGSSNDDD